MRAQRILQIEAPVNPLNEVRSACFHPFERWLCYAVLNDVRVVDLPTGALVAKLMVDERIIHVGVNPSHNFLIACTNEGSVHAWNLHTFAPVICFSIRKEKDFRRPPSISGFAVSTVDPFACTIRQSTSVINVFNLLSKSGGPTHRIETKKPPLDIAFHPSKPLLAAFCSDGLIRIWDYLTGELFAQSDELLKAANQQHIGITAPSYLSFHPTENLVTVACEGGFLGALELDTGAVRFLGSSVLEKKISGMQFHPYHRGLFVIHVDGTMSMLCWGGKVEYFYTNDAFEKLNIYEVEMRTKIPEFIAVGTILEPSKLFFHPSCNYMTVVFSRQQASSVLSLTLSAPYLRFGVYALSSKYSYDTEVKMWVCRLANDAFFSRERSVFEYPASIPFVIQEGIYSYIIATNEVSHVRKLPDSFYGHRLRVSSFLYSPTNQKYVVFFDFKPSPTELEHCYSIIGPGPVSFLHGRCGQLGKNENVLGVLSEDGQTFETFSMKSLERLSETTLGEPITEVFPHPEGFIFLRKNQLVVADEKGKLDESRSFAFEDGETVVQTMWQYNEKGNSTLDLLAVMTNQRIAILSHDLSNVVCSIQAPSKSTFGSCYWVDSALFFTSDYQLNFLTLDGSVHRLCSLKDASAYIGAVLNDRIIYASSFKGKTKIRWRSLGLLQPLLLAQVLLPEPYRLEPGEEKARFQRIVSRFDNVRIDHKLVKLLDKSHHSDLAFALVSGSPFYSPSTKIELALNAHQFETGFELLSEWVATRREEKMLATGKPVNTLDEELIEKIKQVANTYMHFGQFELARKALELGSLDLELLYLFLLHKDRRGIEGLVTRLKSSDDPSKKHVLAACEAQLKNPKLLPKEKTPSKILNWNFETKQSTNWTPTQVTGATMKAVVPDNNQKSGDAEYIPPLGLLDSIAKWLSVTAIDYAPHASDSSQGKYQDQDDQAEGDKSSSSFDNLRPPAPLIMSSRPKSTAGVSSITKRKLIIEEDSSETSTGISDLRDEEESSDEEENLSPIISNLPSTRSPNAPKKKRTRKRSSLLGNSKDPADAFEKVYGSSSDEGVRVPPISKIAAHIAAFQSQQPSPQPLLQVPQPVNDDLRPSEAALPADKDTFSTSTIEPPEYITQGKKYLAMGQSKLDQGQFSAALDDVNQSISTLLSGIDAAEVKPLVKACLVYKLALKLLIEIKLQEKSKNVQRLALLARILADIPLRPHHRIICMRFAINKNLDAENFPAASRYLRMLRTRSSVVDLDSLEQRLKKAMDSQQKAQASLTPLSSLPAASAFDSDEPIARFCFQTFQPILRTGAVIHCPYCDAIYSEKVKKIGEKCVYCSHGTLVKRSTADSPLIALF